MTSMHPSAARSTQNSRIIGSKFQIKLGTSLLDGPFRSQFRSVSLTLGALGLVVGRQLGGRRVRGWVGHGLAIIIFRVLRCWVVKLVIQRCRENSGQQFLQGGWGGWPTGNGKKLSSCQAQLGQATCLAVA